MFISKKELLGIWDRLESLEDKLSCMQGNLITTIYKPNGIWIYNPCIELSQKQRIDALYSHLGLTEIYTEGTSARVCIEKNKPPKRNK